MNFSNKKVAIRPIFVIFSSKAHFSTAMEENTWHRPEGPWRVLEFYSGIGGMRYSVERAGVEAKMVEAFDINNVANDVYQHNFGHRPFQGNIETLSAADLDSYGAHAWLLSPPCQPYTRQGLKKGSADARASSFLKILGLLPEASQPPLVIFVENVVGFETSDTHRIMIEILARAGFATQEFILSPLQFDVPYSRPRYFCLAKRIPSSFMNPLFNHQLLSNPGPLLEHDANNMVSESENQLLQASEPIENFLEFKNNRNSDGVDLGSSHISECNEGNGSDYIDQFLVPSNMIERWGSTMDVVYTDSKRCCCFTKSYYRYFKGTGSLLATVKPKSGEHELLLKDQCLRYFTPKEVANLHCFPKEFSFPESVSLKQRYALLGNSLSVAVVAPLLRYLFTDPS